MIAFLTLFLGIATGVHTVELSAAAHEVDALSGATLTTKGVENLVRFWTGELGFGPFLNHLKSTS